MNAFVARIVSLAAAIAVGLLILGVPAQFWNGLIFIVWLALFYLLFKPVGQAIALPLNLILFNLPQFFVDALLVWWASAWTPLLSLTYLESLLIAALITACFTPFDAARERRLLKNILNFPKA